MSQKGKISLEVEGQECHAKDTQTGMRQLSEFSTSLATGFQKVTLNMYSLHFPLNYPSGETLAHFACLDKNY